MQGLKTEGEDISCCT